MTSPAYENFTDPDAAIAYLETAKFPIVLKADGLALGKGVLICQNFEEAKEGVRTIMLDKKFGTAGNEMVIEEFMTKPLFLLQQRLFYPSCQKQLFLL